MKRAERIRDEIIEWLRDWFKKNGDGCKAVIGISGGCDSTVVAALCAEAIGKENVLGVLMPNVTQPDIDDSYRVINALGINSIIVPITMPVIDIVKQLDHAGIEISDQTSINLPARIRMATLYAVSQSVNGRVINTSNYSERMIGWETRWGDSVGDVCPIAMLTKTEVREIGRTFNQIPDDLIEKAPSDGLTGKTDEENFGFTYDILDQYLTKGVCYDTNELDRILKMRRKNRFKLYEPQKFYPNERGTIYGSC